MMIESFFSTDGLDGVTPRGWIEWEKAEFTERERKRERGNRWVAPEHMKLGKYMRRYADTKNLIMPEPAPILFQRESDRRLRFSLDNLQRP